MGQKDVERWWGLPRSSEEGVWGQFGGFCSWLGDVWGRLRNVWGWLRRSEVG